MLHQNIFRKVQTGTRVEHVDDSQVAASFLQEPGRYTLYETRRMHVEMAVSLCNVAPAYKTGDLQLDLRILSIWKSCGLRKSA
jgi:hypothetical protein